MQILTRKNETADGKVASLSFARINSASSALRIFMIDRPLHDVRPRATQRVILLLVHAVDQGAYCLCIMSAAMEIPALRTVSHLLRPQSLTISRHLRPSQHLTTLPLRALATTSHKLASPTSFLGSTSTSSSSSSSPSTYFPRQSLPANTVVRFVPQQTAWIVERMGKFNRILQPGLAILIPFLDRIAYVKSLKEAAMEIPSQSAITADNVTLELDGVLYTRVVDAYRAR